MTRITPRGKILAADFTDYADGTLQMAFNCAPSASSVKSAAEFSPIGVIRVIRGCGPLCKKLILLGFRFKVQ